MRHATQLVSIYQHKEMLAAAFPNRNTDELQQKSHGAVNTARITNKNSESREFGSFIDLYNILVVGGTLVDIKTKGRGQTGSLQFIKDTSLFLC